MPVFDKSLRYSYAAQKNRRIKFLWIFLCVLGLFVLYSSLTSFFFSIRALENDTMRPELRSGDRFVFTSFSLYSMLSEFDAFHGSVPFRRGDIVLIDKAARRSIPTALADSLVRFFTAQRKTLGGRDEFVKRVIGLPGDEITITNFVVRVKPADSQYNLTEFELASKPYEVNIPQVPALWDDSIPFSRDMGTLTLGAGECFVLSDDRGNTNDSRTWGPLPVSQITGKAIFRYWPLTRLGRP